MESFGFPSTIFPEIVPSGTIMGPLLPSVADEAGLEDVKVIATCSHDTQAAVAAVPARGSDWCYISSGTWSLMGIEASAPIINRETLKFGFSNEQGLNNTTCYLKNIVGLKDLTSASDLAEGLFNNVDRPPVYHEETGEELFPGEALPHFNEVDEC
jgi:rhamnulokinase